MKKKAQAESSPAVELTFLTSDQWSDYRAIRLRALQSDQVAFGWTYEEMASLPSEYWIERLSNKKSFHLIAVVDNQQVGTAGLHLQSHAGAKGTASIVGVWVDPQHRRKGIAEALLSKLLEVASSYSEVAKVRINVSESRKSAQALYHKLGFELVDRLKDSATIDGVVYDELILEKSIR